MKTKILHTPSKNNLTLCVLVYDVLLRPLCWCVSLALRLKLRLSEVGRAEIERKTKIRFSPIPNSRRPKYFSAPIYITVWYVYDSDDCTKIKGILPK